MSSKSRSMVGHNAHRVGYGGGQAVGIVTRPVLCLREPAGLHLDLSRTDLGVRKHAAGAPKPLNPPRQTTSHRPSTPRSPAIIDRPA